MDSLLILAALVSGGLAVGDSFEGAALAVFGFELLRADFAGCPPVVALFPDDEKTPHDLFRAANQALLRAKLPPKNRVVYFRPPGEWQSRLR